MPPVRRRRRDGEGGGLRIINVQSAGASMENTVIVKEEPRSDSESCTEEFESVDVKQEKMSGSEKSISESESPACSEGEEARSDGSTKKRFKRIIELDDSSDSDGSESSLPVLRKKKFKRVKIENSGESENNDRRKLRGGDESQSSETEASSSDSESSKGVIEFESSGDSDGDTTEKSYTSSEQEEVDWTDLKKECMLCRNLGRRDFRYRSTTNSTNWCRCGECRIVGHMKDYDRICCREIKDVVEFLDEEMEDASKKHLCITSHPRFEIDVMKFQALQRTHYYRTDHYGNTNAYMACWSFIRWIWDKLQWGNRMVVPACVTSKIKSEFGCSGVSCYSAVSTCDKSRHCRQSQL